MQKALITFFCCLYAIFSFAQGTTDASVLTYTQDEFDSDTCCWRMLSKQGHYDSATHLMRTYLKHGNTTNKGALKWHTGQVYAFAEDKKMAKRYFRKTIMFAYPLLGEDLSTWYFYVKGSIAFINRDKPRLQHYIHKWDKRKYYRDRNYKALTTLLKNWDMSYKDAN